VEQEEQVVQIVFQDHQYLMQVVVVVDHNQVVELQVEQVEVEQVEVLLQEYQQQELLIPEVEVEEVVVLVLLDQVEPEVQE
jgi:hypothetical protein